MLDKDMQLKFEEGSTTEPLTIMKAGIEELDFGNKHVVHIKPLITGHDHFLPSDGLINKMKEENVNTGDQITIEKARKSEKYPYGYFSVKVVHKEGGPDIAESPVKAGFVPKEDKLTLYELSLRIGSFEQEIVELKKAIAELKKDDIPF